MSTFYFGGFYDTNVTLKVKSVSEKNSIFKVLGNDTFKVSYAIFPYYIKINHSCYSNKT